MADAIVFLVFAAAFCWMIGREIYRLGRSIVRFIVDDPEADKDADSKSKSKGKGKGKKDNPRPTDTDVSELVDNQLEDPA